MSPLDDAECLEYSFNETPREVEVFRAGWLFRRVHGKDVLCEARTLPWICDLSQDERISFERGWYASDVVRKALLIEGVGDVENY